MKNFIMPMAGYKDRILKIFSNRTFLLSLSLAVVTAAVFLSVCRCDFVNYDDNFYIMDNPHIRGGFTLEGLKWAFSTGLLSKIDTYLDYWQPVTVLSRMTDMQLYGLNPAGHHLTSLILHILNVLVLFAVLKKMTGAVYRSAVAAAIFAIHPLQVETVAWVTARKDVLSMFFGLLTVWAYAGYADKPDLKRGLAVFSLFCLALMSKPMMMTLPFVLLLLDYWPLARAGAGTGPGKWRIGLRLVAEKIPLFLLTFFSVFVAFQSRAADVIRLSVGLKVSNAVVFYISYLVKWVVPVNLSLWYAQPGVAPFLPLPLWQVVAAAAGIAAVLAAAVIFSRKAPYFLVGWLWYLGTFLPVISLRPSDRFMYLPMIGLAMITVWGIPVLADRLRVKKSILTAGAAGILLIWSGLAFIQVGYWRDSITLFEHARAAGPKDFAMEYLLGSTLAKQGRYREAVPYYENAVKFKPEVAPFHAELGLSLLNADRPDEAERHLREAIRLAPLDFFSYQTLAELLKKSGREKEAEICLSEARQKILPVLLEIIRRDPNEPKALSFAALLLVQTGSPEEAVPYFEQFMKTNSHAPGMSIEYGALLEKLGRFEDALVVYKKAIRNDPQFEKALIQAGNILANSGFQQEAEQYYTQALRANPKAPLTLHALANALAQQGKYQQAIPYYAESIRLSPNDAKVYYNLGYSLTALGRYAEATEQFKTALGLEPQYADAYLNIGYCYSKLGKFEDAAAHYEKSLALNPDNEKAHYGAGMSLESLGKVEEAKLHYAAALAIRPDDGAVRARMAALSDSKK